MRGAFLDHSKVTPEFDIIIKNYEEDVEPVHHCTIGAEGGEGRVARITGLAKTSILGKNIVLPVSWSRTIIDCEDGTTWEEMFRV